MGCWAAVASPDGAPRFLQRENKFGHAARAVKRDRARRARVAISPYTDEQGFARIRKTQTSRASRMTARKYFF